MLKSPRKWPEIVTGPVWMELVGVVEWNFSDLQIYPHYQHPYHHSLEIASGLLVAGDY